jgi:tetratricopeptide (TPR) repeat protein
MGKYNLGYHYRAIRAMLLSTLIILMTTSTQASGLKGGLDQGPYGIGFKAIERYDYSRSFGPKRDYFGAVIPGERGRPIQICLWYPAEPESEAVSAVYGEYAFVYPDDTRFFDFLSNLQNRELGVLFRYFGNNRDAVMEIMSVEMAAVRDAPHAEGSFPLLIYHPDFNNNVTENSILFEFLASHGFVVAATHSFGTTEVLTQGGASDLETAVGDMEFTIAALHDLEFIDSERLGALGYGSGGTAALLLQMRNSYVDAVLCMEPAHTDPESQDLVDQSPYYDPRRVAVPLMQMIGRSETERDLSLFESLTYSDRYSVEFGRLSTFDFTSYAPLSTTVLELEQAAVDQRLAGYNVVTRYILNFYDAHLRGSDEGRAFLSGSPEENGFAAESLVIERMQAEDLPPTPNQFLAIVTDRGVDEAAEIYRKFRAQDPELMLFQEAQFNALGYRFLGTGQMSEAIEVFRMNADTYPGSANCWDSLAEAYIASGDNQLAIECVEKVLEVLPNDSNASEQLKEQLRANAERYLEQLREEEQ